MKYEIEFLKENDFSKVSKFINNEWEKGHILSKSKNLFDWQYLNLNKSYNFIILKNKNEILGILGFIPSCRYDKNLIKENIIWLALWKISEKVKIKGIGLKMISFLKRNVAHIGIGVNGINKSHPKMYKALGYQAGNLNHYYSVNKNLESKLISSTKEYNHPSLNQKGLKWKILSENDCRNFEEQFNYEISPHSEIKKTPIYFLNRYIKHPYYCYQVYLIPHPNEKEAALISIRIDKKNNSKVVRIVDYYGSIEILNYAGFGLKNIVDEYLVEYIDFWSYGIPDKIMKNFGFKIVESQHNVIVPNYFEPFENKNNEILFAYKNINNSKNKFIICKGDGDQDRPNILKKK
tara:strand:+ start:2418 stop:3464 length:1047 start_codon:yes stop_codon:yes gene_type:complete